MENDAEYFGFSSAQPCLDETFQSTEMGILESESNTYHDDDSTASDRVLGGTRLVAKFIGSQPGIIRWAADEGETCQRTDVCSVDSESNTHQDDGSTASGGSQEGKGETYQRTKMGIVESESCTYLDDGSTSTDKGFLVSENNTCHVDVSTTADGMLMVADSRGSPAVKSNADKGEPDSHGSQAGILKELISKDFKGETCQTTDVDSESNTCHDDASAASGGSPEGKGEIYQRTDMDSESNTYAADGSTASKGALAGTHFTVKVDGSQAVISSEVIKGEPDSHGSQAVILEELISKDGKGEIYQSFLESENNNFLVDLSTTADEILLVEDSRVSPAVKSKAGEGALNTVPHYFVSRTNADEGRPYFRNVGTAGRPYLHFENNTFRDDGPTTKESISLCNDLSVSPTVIPMSGKGETSQITDVCSPDSESNTPRNDADSGGSQEGKVQQSSMESLPADIVQDILSRVPAEFVLGCKLVCKKWVTLIRGSYFANMHLSRQLNHLHDGDDDNDNLAAEVESSLFFACCILDTDVCRTLLLHGGQLSHRISTDEKNIYNQNLKRIYHPRMHTKRIYNHLVGSCNGLVCAFHYHNLVMDPIYICNPLTREYVYLPQLVVKEENVDPEYFRIEGGEVDMHNNTACGFGYVRSTNEYKVVRIHYLDYEE